VVGDRFTTARVYVRSTQPLSIGIGRTGAVARYVAGVQHDQGHRPARDRLLLVGVTLVYLDARRPRAPQKEA
jgi:hypothetical protein